jgi:hypothetical protein
MRTTIFLFLTVLTFENVYCQREKSQNLVKSSQPILYCGIDFSHTRIIGESENHIKQIRDSLFQKINIEFLLHEMEKVKRTISTEIIPDEKLIQSLNSNFADASGVLDSVGLQSIINGYNLSLDTGKGLVFIVLSIDRLRRKAELYPVIFEISSRKVIWTKKITGKASDAGPPHILNYWRTKVYGGIWESIYSYKTEQEEKTGKIKPSNIYLKLLVDEIDLGFETRVSPGVNMTVEAGYRFNYLDSWHYSGQPVPVEYLYRFLAFSGFICRVEVKCKVSRCSYIVPVLGYQHLYCPEVIYDPAGYAGSGDKTYQVWSQYNDEFVLQLLHHIDLGRFLSRVQFFYGIGGKLCKATRYYSIDGRGDHQIPSNQVVNVTIFQPLVTFGFIFKLFSF